MPTLPEGEDEAAPVPAVIPQAVGLSTLVAFDPMQESWSKHIERIEHYFTANNIISDEKRRAILLNAVEELTYPLIKCCHKNPQSSL